MGTISRTESRNAQEDSAVQHWSNYRFLLKLGPLWVGGANFPTGLVSLHDRVFAWKLVKNQ